MFSWYKEEEEEVVTVRAQWVWTGTEGTVEGERSVCLWQCLLISFYLFICSFFFFLKTNNTIIICKLLPG